MPGLSLLLPFKSFILFLIVLWAVITSHTFPMFRNILLCTVVCCLWPFGPWKRLGLTGPRRAGGQQDSASRGYPGRRDSSLPQWGGGHTSRRVLAGLAPGPPREDRKGRGQVAGSRVPPTPLSHWPDGSAAPGKILPWLRSPGPFPVSHTWFQWRPSPPPKLAGPQDPSPPSIPSLPCSHPSLSPQLLLLRSRGNSMIKPQTTLACLFKPMCTCGPLLQAEQEFPTGRPGRKCVVGAGAGVGGTVQRQVQELGMCRGKSLSQGTW